MARVVGVDFRDNHVRVVGLTAGFRKLELGALAEELLSAHQSKSEALKACLARMPAGGVDTVAVSVEGSRCFVHRLDLPASARKRLSELLPFELESVLPVEIDELVVDHSILPAASASQGDGFSVLTVAARLEHVQETIDVVKEATGRQPERIGCSGTELGQLPFLFPELKVPGAVALMDLSFSKTEICIVEDGAVQMARTLSLGVEGFPDSSAAWVARIRQSFGAFATQTGRHVEKIVLMGEGATMDGIDAFLSDRISLPVEPLPRLALEGVDTLDLDRTAGFAKAYATAMHAVRGKGFDLRQGDLSFERGYEHVKARAPLFGSMVAAVILSFLFSVWAESRALAAENEALLGSLADVTKSTFGTGTDDPDEAENELEKARKIRPEDPMPYIDGFGLAVVLAEVLPTDIKHDVEEFEFAKKKLKIRGQVDSADDAQKVAKLLGEHRCINDPKVTKITQVVNSDRERYVLEADVSCPQDAGSSKSKKKSKKSGGDK